jgi:cobalt-precorrin-5B (C1)-methyltransferase
MIRHAISEVAAAAGGTGDVEIEIAIAGGEELAKRTLNPRLGILGGLSVLGTNGVVIPYSCSAWIAAIRQGIDVARALGLTHLAGATGRASEEAVKQLHGLPEPALIDMGDFVGAMLKYLYGHVVPRVTIAGGVAKMTKLAQGLLDLHSQRGSVDREFLASLADRAGGSPLLRQRILASNTAAEAFEHAQAETIRLGDAVAVAAQATAMAVVQDRGIAIEIVLFDREGRLVGRAPFATGHGAPRRKRRT